MILIIGQNNEVEEVIKESKFSELSFWEREMYENILYANLREVVSLNGMELVLSDDDFKSFLNEIK